MLNSQRNETKGLVQDYVAWRLAKSGHYHWHQANNIDLKENTKNKLCTAMRHFAYKFEDMHSQENRSDELEITSFNCRDAFLALLFELFELNAERNESLHLESECKSEAGFKSNWGRVIAVFAFAGSLAKRLYELKLTNLIYTIIDTQVDFLNNDKRMFAWIESQGGWNSFLDYFNDRYNLIKLENIDLPIEDLNNTITRSNYFFKFHNSSPAHSKIKSVDYLESIQNQCKSFFKGVGTYTGVAVGSIGFLALGAVYYKKKL